MTRTVTERPVATLVTRKWVPVKVVHWLFGIGRVMFVIAVALRPYVLSVIHEEASNEEIARRFCGLVEQDS